MYRIPTIITILLLLAGIANGITDSLQFHYPTSFAAEWNPDYWNPNKSWESKYQKDAEGELVRPLTPRYFGSTTFLVFTTDAWHLFKFIHHAFLRVAIVWLLVLHVVGLFGLQLKRWQLIVGPVGIYIFLWAAQAIGFHLFYTLL